MAPMGSGPDMKQVLRNGQPIQNMSRPMPPNRGPPQPFTPQEQQHILAIASQITQNMSIQDQENVKTYIPPHQYQNMEAQGINPIQAFIRSQASKRFQEDKERRQRATQELAPPSTTVMPNQGRPTSQVSMRNPGQQAMPSSAPQQPDASFALGNMDQFLGQQQDALRHQEAGQMVVPMSNPQGETPQVRGTPSTHGQNQFMVNRPMPPPNAFQPPSQAFWNNQLNQQPNPQQPSQIQIQPPAPSFNGVPGHAAQLQGQLGGLSSNRTQRTPHQNHNMPTLNQPLDSKAQAHTDPAQRPAQPNPKVSRRSGSSIPQAAVPNAQQNGGQQRPQASMVSQGHNQLPPDIRARLMSLPADKRKEWVLEFQKRQTQQRMKQMADAKNAVNSEVSLQSGQQSDPASVVPGQVKAPTAVHPQDNAATAFNMQPQINQQQVPSNGARNTQPKLAPIKMTELQMNQMDPLQFPPIIINRNSDLGNLPDDVRTWRQLKEHVQRNERELPTGSLLKIEGLQSIHYQINLKHRELQRNQPQPRGGTGTAPVGRMIPQQYNQPVQGPVATGPNTFRFPPLPEPTTQELQAARHTLPPQMKEIPDNQLRVMMMKQRQQDFFQTPQAQQAFREQQRLHHQQQHQQQQQQKQQQQQQQHQQQQQQQQQQQHQQQIQKQQQQQRNTMQKVQHLNPQRQQFQGAPTQQGQLQQVQQPPIQVPQRGQPRGPAQQQSRQSAQPPKPTAGPAWTGFQTDTSKTNQKNLKRNSSEDVIEVPDPKLSQQQSRIMHFKANQPAPAMSSLPNKEQMAQMTPEQRMKVQRHLDAQAAQRMLAAQASGQLGLNQTNVGIANRNNSGLILGRDPRYGQLMQEVAQTTPRRPEVPMSPKARKQMVDRLSEKVAVVMKKVEVSLPVYLDMTKDENRTKELLRIVSRLFS